MIWEGTHGTAGGQILVESPRIFRRAVGLFHSMSMLSLARATPVSKLPEDSRHQLHINPPQHAFTALTTHPSIRPRSKRAIRVLRSMHGTGLPQAPLTPSAPLSAYGYLGATAHRTQPLCGNAEGWGPLSPIRYDFTPCFLDVWISAVAVGGIVCGAGAVWYLLRKRSPEPVKKNWHFLC